MFRTNLVRSVVAATVLAIVVASLALMTKTEDARASVPTGTPTFSNPLTFTNRYFPFVPGAIKVFRGKSEGEKTTVVDRYLSETRSFDWNGTVVECAILTEIEFEDGELVEISMNYFAQADDGTVYYFGETVDEFDEGTILHCGSWLVGGPSGDDPVETADVDDPAVFMPGNVEVGDVWKPENIPDEDIVETDTARRLDKKVKVEAGKFRDCLEVQEVDFDGSKERKWYAPGIGVIKAKAKREKLALVATTLILP